MAVEYHPDTGVALNVIEVERKSLGLDEAVTAHLMRARGVQYHQIAQQLGTNTMRVGEVLRGEKHPEAAGIARKILGRPEAGGVSAA